MFAHGSAAQWPHTLTPPPSWAQIAFLTIVFVWHVLALGIPPHLCLLWSESSECAADTGVFLDTALHQLRQAQMVSLLDNLLCYLFSVIFVLLAECCHPSQGQRLQWARDTLGWLLLTVCVPIACLGQGLESLRVRRRAPELCATAMQNSFFVFLMAALLLWATLRLAVRVLECDVYLVGPWALSPPPPSELGHHHVRLCRDNSHGTVCAAGDAGAPPPGEAQVEDRSCWHATCLVIMSPKTSSKAKKRCAELLLQELDRDV